MAAGAWSAAAEICTTTVNANPFRKEGTAAEPRHFDPYQLMPRRAAPRQPAPGVKMRVGQLKHIITGTD